MQAVGFIETRGITAAIIGVDAMLKSANVSILEKTFVGGGIVSIAITGDIGAVTAAVEAGEASIKTLDSSLIITKHIIPRPAKSLENSIIFPMLSEEDTLEDSVVEKKENEIEIKLEEVVEEIEEVAAEETAEEIEEDTKDIIENDKPNNKKDLDSMVVELGIDKVNEVLWKAKVKELRKLARKYEDFGIKGRDISIASKDTIIKEFKKYYDGK